jgi:hypothetical protein
MRGVGWYLVTRNLVLLGAALTLVLLAPASAVRQGASDDPLRSEADGLRNAT